MKTLTLPKPDAEFGHFALPDGSIIYPSGSSYYDKSGNEVKMPDQGKFFLWLNEDGGRVVLTRTGIRYFKRPEDALAYYEKEYRRK